MYRERVFFIKARKEGPGGHRFGGLIGSRGFISKGGGDTNVSSKQTKKPCANVYTGRNCAWNRRNNKIPEGGRNFGN